jgi:Ca2+-binding RTX toxin-like protein
MSPKQVLRFENAHLFGRGKVTLNGTNGPNHLAAAGSPLSEQPSEEPAYGATIYGRAGNDVLEGSSGTPGENLIGGAGYDTAMGRAGNDRCRAEIRHSCER